MGIPFHSKLRKKLRAILNSSAVKLFSTKSIDKEIDVDSIKKILLIRMNYRIGNIIFMTPLIRALNKKLPNATIDMVVGASFTAPIVEGMTNVGKVYDMPRKLLKSPKELFKLIKEVNKNEYDLIISPINGSVSSNLTVLLLRAKIKLGFFSDKNWIPFNRTVLPDKTIIHEALKPLVLMDIFSGEKLSYDNFLNIDLSDMEKDDGQKMLSSLLSTNNILKNNAKIIGIFRDARNEKKIEPKWWIEFISDMKKIDKTLIFVDILNPNEKEPLIKDMLYISSSNLRELGKFLSALDMFVCGDTGPMHLASASLTPVVAFFNATSSSLYGPLGKQDKAIEIQDKAIKSVADEVYTQIRTVIK